MAALAEATPGPGIASWLAGTDPADLGDAGRVDALRAWERQAAWVAGMQQRVLAAIARDARPGEAVPHDDWARDEVAAALRLAPATADRRLRVARALDSPCSDTAALLAAGEITYRHAACLVEETESLAPAAVMGVESRVLSRAPGQSVSEFRRAVRRAVLAADPSSAQEAHDQAVQGRYVRYFPADDGMAEIAARLSAEGAESVMAALRCVAATMPSGTADQRRADALVALAVAAGEQGTSDSGCSGPVYTVGVTVRAETLAGLDDEPGDLTGYGPITAESARRLAENGQWRRMLVDATSATLLDVGRRSYRPSVALARFVRARDVHCTFPHCLVPAARCDVDHAVPFAAGGATDRANLGTLCRRHHRAKHEGGWTLVREPDGTAAWTCPAGKIYRVGPPGFA